jgi:hypothetical protein
LKQREADWAKTAALAKARLVNTDSIAVDREKPRPRVIQLAIDSKLAVVMFITLQVKDVAPAGYATDRAIVRQRRQADQSSSN